MTLCNVGPMSKTLGRRCINAIQMCCVCWAGGFSLKHSTFVQCWFNFGPTRDGLGRPTRAGPTHARFAAV